MPSPSNYQAKAGQGIDAKVKAIEERLAHQKPGYQQHHLALPAPQTN